MFKRKMRSDLLYTGIAKRKHKQKMAMGERVLCRNYNSKIK